ncbi:MAG: YMGG-like glycine zipper-containing protein, partial [Succinatimonas sp.]|nr:YMGG-like glycine zipper-containing protein [Succinatimonas sp.]
KNDNTSNTILGAVGGALLGNLISKNSTGTAVGAGLGALAAGSASKYMDRHDGVRLTIDSDNGPLIVDMPFSCKYAVGKKVRLISGSSQGSVMVKQNGRYVTATEDSYTKCPATYNAIKNN